MIQTKYAPMCGERDEETMIPYKFDVLDYHAIEAPALKKIILMTLERLITQRLLVDQNFSFVALASF